MISKRSPRRQFLKKGAALAGLAAGAISSPAQNLFAATGILNALDLRLNLIDLVIVRPRAAEIDALLSAARAHAGPNLVLSLHEDAARLPPGHPAAGKAAVGDRVTAYVCRGETCSLPIREPDALAATLRGDRVE